MDYQWYPGHMTKTVRELQENIKLIDLIIELVDARIPVSSRNPDFDRLANGKSRMVLISKSDIADETETAFWTEWYKKRNLHPYVCDMRKNGALKGLTPAIREVCKEKIERDRRKGIMNRPIRVMVAGIPNVGKSTFINSFSGTSSLKTGNKPGVTRGRQWISMKGGVQLLDTPGLLWPKFQDPEVGKKIALIGSMPDAIVDVTELSCELLRMLAGSDKYAALLAERYGVETAGAAASLAGASAVLSEIAQARGCLKKGGEADPEKAAAIVLDDFRSGRLGRITLDERPVEKADEEPEEQA